MDFLEDYRFIECLRAGVPADMNVYDAAALSVVCELTERSVADRSRPQDFPTSRAASGRRPRRSALSDSQEVIARTGRASARPLPIAMAELSLGLRTISVHQIPGTNRHRTRRW